MDDLAAVRWTRRVTGYSDGVAERMSSDSMHYSPAPGLAARTQTRHSSPAVANIHTYPPCRPLFTCYTHIPERQSAWMSKITHNGLTRSGTACFIAVPIWQQMGVKGLSDPFIAIELRQFHLEVELRQMLLLPEFLAE